MRVIRLLPLLLLLLLIAPASATWYNISYAPSSSLNAKYTEGSGMMISQVEIYDLATPSNTSIVLTEPGGYNAYTVWYNTTYWGAIGGLPGASVRAEGSIEYSGNATKTTFDRVNHNLLFAYWNTAKTDLIIQYALVGPSAWRIRLAFSCYPGAFVGDWAQDITYQDNAGSIIPFGEVQVDSTDEFTADVYYADAETFAQIQSGNFAATQIGGIIWDGILWAVAAIPVIGPALEQAITWIGILVTELLWLIKYALIDNWLGTLVLIEFLAISEALIYGQRKSNIAIMKRVAQNHVFLFTALIGIVMFLYYDIILRTIEALGQLIPG